MSYYLINMVYNVASPTSLICTFWFGCYSSNWLACKKFKLSQACLKHKHRTARHLCIHKLFCSKKCSVCKRTAALRENDVSVCNTLPRISHECHMRAERQAVLLKLTLAFDRQSCHPSPMLMSLLILWLHKLWEL